MDEQMGMLELYSLLEMAGIEYDEITVRQGDVTVILRPIKFPPRKYKYFQLSEDEWAIHESIDGGPFKLILKIVTDDITKLYPHYHPSELYCISYPDGR